MVSLSGPSSNAYIQAAVDLVDKIHREQAPGHILLFLTGQDEIEDACTAIRARTPPRDIGNRYRGERKDRDEEEDSSDLLVLPIYSSMPSEQQQRVFRKYPDSVRKCVIATNIAETSITVPNVRYVIDPGFVKQKAYDPTRRMETLVTVPISQVSPKTHSLLLTFS